MSKADILIYEFKNSFFVIQRSQQGKTALPATQYQRASENATLFVKLDISCSNEEMGKSVVGALDKFDAVLPQYDPWELKELNAQLCSWVGARGINVLNRNSRLVQVIRDDNKLKIIPFDNHIKNRWYSPMIKIAGYNKDIIITLPSDSSFEITGKSVFDAFQLATYHPKRQEDF